MDVALQTKLIEATGSKWSAGQGNYFKACNGTPGTGITSNVPTAFSSTSALFMVENHAPAASALDQGTGALDSETATYLVLDYVKLLGVGSDTGGTAIQYVGFLDNIFRFSAGGFAPITPELGSINVLQQPSIVAGKVPNAQWHFGAVTLNAASANRLLMARGCMKSNAAAPIVVPNDEYYWSFGMGYDVGAGAVKGGTTAAIYRQNAGLVIVPPGCSFMMHTYYPALTVAFTFELEVAWWELPCAVTTGAQ